MHFEYCKDCIEASSGVDFFSIIRDLATLFIALVNIYYIYQIRKDDKREEEVKNVVEWQKDLFVRPNIKDLFVSLSKIRTTIRNIHLFIDTAGTSDISYVDIKPFLNAFLVSVENQDEELIKPITSFDFDFYDQLKSIEDDMSDEVRRLILDHGLLHSERSQNNIEESTKYLYSTYRDRLLTAIYEKFR